jgi:outer membrane lipoprotein LolB
VTRAAAALALLLALAGCAGRPARAPAADPAAAWSQRQQALAPIDAWRVSGRVAVQTDTEGWQASVVWRRRGAEQRIDLTGPLGRGHLRLTQDAHGAQLEDAERRVQRAANAEELLLRATGWQVPLDGLNSWLLGLPAPGAAADRELDAWGRLSRLRQLGWDIEFLEYRPHGPLELPGRLFMKRRAPPALAAGDGVTIENGTLEVRLVIDGWAFEW